jgi:hypothetical protein
MQPGMQIFSPDGNPTEGRKAARNEDSPPTSVSLFDQGLIQVLQTSMTGLEPKQPCIHRRR